MKHNQQQSKNTKSVKQIQNQSSKYANINKIMQRINQTLISALFNLFIFALGICLR